MCGIVGLVRLSDSAIKESDATKWLHQSMYVNGLRGFDGTGMYVVGEEGNLEGVSRLPLPVADFIRAGYHKDVLDSTDKWWACVAHNRAATQGGISLRNTHPFSHNHITLVHNGTMSPANLPGNWSQTDSERICLALAENDNPKEVLESLRGPFALVWYNSITKTLFLTRNEDRPLTLALSKDKKTLFFSSEGWITSSIAQRIGIDLEDEGVRSLRKNNTIELSFDNTKEFDWDNLPGFNFKPYNPPVVSPGWEWSKRINPSDGAGDKKSSSPAKNKVKNAALLYERTGILQNDVVPFRVLSWTRESYKKRKSKFGAITSLVYGATPTLGVSHHVQEKTYKGLQNKLCWGKVTSVTFCPVGAFTRVFPVINANSSLVIDNASSEEIEKLYEKYMSSDIPEDVDKENHEVKYTGPHGVILPEKEWLALTSDGCSVCAAKILLTDRVAWEDRKPICKECISK